MPISASLRRFIAGLLFLLASSLCADAQQTTRGKDFYVAFLPNIHNFGLMSADSLFLYVVAEAPTSGTIQYSDGSNIFTRAFTITNPAQVFQFAVQWSSFELLGYNQSIQFVANNDNERASRRVFRITATEDVAVYAMNHATTTADAAMLYPVQALGTEYVVLTYNADGVLNGSVPSTSYTPSQFCVVATEDNTRISVVPSVPSLASGSSTKSFVLSKGQAWLCQSDFSSSQLNYDFSGTRIIASAPVAVFSGHQRALIPLSARDFLASRDHLFEQLPPVSVWGSSYIITPLANPQGAPSALGANDIFRVIAANDNTVVRLNGVIVARLNRYQTYEAPLTAAGLLTANDRICVALYKRSFSDGGGALFNGDPFMLIVPPRAQYLKRYRFTNCQVGNVYASQFVTVITAQTNSTSITLDGQPLSATWRAVPNTCYVYANIEMTNGVHTLQSPRLFGLYVYGYGPAISYGYVGGMAFVPDVGNDAVTAGNDLDICIGDTATVASTGKAVSLKWSTLRSSLRIPCDTCASFLVAPTQTTTFVLNGVDSLGCSILDSVTVTVHAIPTVDATPDTVVCSDAPIILRAEGSFESVEWSPPVGLSCTTCAVTSARPGRDIVYTATVRNGPSPRCSAIDSVRIRYAKGFADAFPKPLSVCRGDSVRVQVPYSGSLRWSPSTGLSCSDCADVVITPTRSVRYTITGDSAGCWSQATLDVVVVDPPSLIVPPDTSLCAGSSLSVTLRTNASDLRWEPTSFLPSANLRVVTFVPDSSIEYVIRAANAQGCSVQDTFRVRILRTPRIVADTTVITACAGSSVRLNTTISDADSIAWSPPDGLSCTACPSPTVLAVTDTRVTVTAWSKEGCSRSLPFLISVKPAPSLVPASDSLRACVGEAVVLVARSDSGKVIWDSATGLSCTECDSTRLVVTGSRYYHVRAVGTGCERSDSVWVEALPRPVVTVTVDDDTLCETSGVAKLQARSDRADASFAWSPPDGLSCTACPDPMARPAVSTTYVLRVLSRDGCESVRQIPITVAPCERRLRTRDTDLGSFIACDARDTSVTFVNEGEIDVRCDSVSIVRQTGCTIKLLDTPALPRVLKPGDTLRVRVRVTPMQAGDADAELGCHCNAGFGGSDTVHVARIVLQTRTLDVTVALLPATVNEGSEFDLPVQLRSTTWNGAPLRAIGLRIRYDKAWMRFADTVIAGAGRMRDGWTVRASREEMRGDDVMLSLVLTGGIPLTDDEIVALPRFRVLLSSVPSFRPRVDSVWFFSQDVCLRPIMLDAVVLPLGCVREIRRVELSSDVFALHTVMPNPLTSQEAEIEYSLGFEAPLRIDLVDVHGSVYTLVDRKAHAAGRYSLRCSTRDVPSGSYQCVYTAAGVVSTLPVRIVR